MNRPKCLFFGIYDPQYPRNRVLMRGFRENGFTVVQCRVDLNFFKGVHKFIELVREYRKLKERDFEYVIVAFPAQSVVWLARILFGKHIIVDSFLSLFDSNVNDRQLYSARSFHGVRDWILDWYSIRLAEQVLFDTEEHLQYAEETFHMSRHNMSVVFVGTDDTIFYPMKDIPRMNTEICIVHFHGSFIPLHGVETIIAAAKLLESEEDILFEIIGNGQESVRIGEYVRRIGAGKNIRFLPRLSYRELAHTVARATICLGIFGTTDKANRVIPNKVFEALASRKPLITRESAACRKLLCDKKNVVFCRAGDPEDLSRAVLELKKDSTYRESIAYGGYELFTRKLKPSILVRRLIG